MPHIMRCIHVPKRPKACCSLLRMKRKQGSSVKTRTGNGKMTMAMSIGSSMKRHDKDVLFTDKEGIFHGQEVVRDHGTCGNLFQGPS